MQGLFNYSKSQSPKKKEKKKNNYKHTGNIRKKRERSFVRRLTNKTRNKRETFVSINVP